MRTRTVGTKIIILFVSVLFFVAFSTPIFAQTVRAQVKMILERLSMEKQNELKDFGKLIEDYINNQDWTGEVTGEEIPIRIQIFLKDKSVSYEERYSGTFLISNNLDAQYYDKYWVFPYRKGEMLDNNIFHPLTGFIDFYVNIILGNELDKYDRLLGTPFFEKARALSEQGMFGTQYAVGWRERSDLIEYILSEERKAFRLMKDSFYLGKYYIDEEDATTARKHVKEALVALSKLIKANPEDKESTQFLQAHHMEFVDLLKEDPDSIEILMRIDPDHASIYESYLN